MPRPSLRALGVALALVAALSSFCAAQNNPAQDTPDNSNWSSSSDRSTVAAVPASLIDDVALIGPTDRIRDRAQRWEASIVDTILLGGRWAGIEPVARTLLN